MYALSFISVVIYILHLVLSQSIEITPGQVATYTVVAPKKLRPNLEYHVSVSVHDVLKPVDFTVVVAGPADSGAYNRVSRSTRLNPRETQIISFDIGEWGSGRYNLTVTGQGSLTFENTTSLEYEHKSYSVFVQTDKAVYKPGHLVQFRVIVVNPYLLPTVTGAIDIYVTDAKKNRIRQWKRVFTSKGIVTESLQLSDFPVLGEWAIHVNVLNQTFEKAFTVAEYVLPTYDVQIQLPNYATYNKSEIVATVKAEYTYGKPVKGNVTLTVAPLTRYNYLTVRPYESFQVKSQIDGSTDFYITLRRDLNLRTDFFAREIEFFALVEEELTGRKYNTTNTMKIFDKDIKVDLIKTSKTFKPGLKYTAFLSVAYQDDTPVNDDSQLKLLYGYSYNEQERNESFHNIPTNGLIELTFYPPINATVLNLRAEFRGQIHYLESLESAISPSKSFLQALVLTSVPKVGQDIEVAINATEPVTHIVYEVMGRGDIVFAQAVQVENARSHRFSFPVTHRMAPRARIVVYYVKPSNGEVVADSINFDVEGIFRTPVSISTDTRETKPGGRVNIRVQTKPNAYVGLLGIDQSILLIKSGNDITQSQVIEELESYDSGKTEKEFPPWYESPRRTGRRNKRSLWWTGSTSAAEIFEDSGTVILSNGLVYQFEQIIYYRMSHREESFQEDAVSARMNFNLQEGKKSEKTTIRLRKHFPETWLWEAALADNDGVASVTSSIPDTITSWIISAFAMDPITGLGISPESTKVTVFRPFFIKLSLPSSVMRGESVAIQIVVFNYLNKPIQAEITMENRKSEFLFSGNANDVNVEGGKENSKTKQISVQPQDGTAISFLITPLILGNIEIRVSASSSLAGDAVSKNLLVKPEGTPQYFNKAVLIDLRNPSSQKIKQNITVAIPHNAIEGSTRVSVTAIGDLLGSSVNNLDQLLHMPFGCGEQNMVQFVPNIVIVEYLRRANRLSANIEAKARGYTESGYQRELTYKREDGSFSAFGDRDKAGSTWLTSFVVKSFSQAESFIDIDEKVIDDAKKWLISNQINDGSFKEPGEVHHKAMQGGSGSGAALTAFVLIALLENPNQRDYSREINAAQRFLVTELRPTNDPYIMAIGCYALHLANDPSKDSMFQKLNGMAKREDGMMYWTNLVTPINTTDKQSDYYFLPSSQDIEMTAYALLTFALRTDVAGALPAMRWLISKQNENGGFSSTQDTVIGIQALGKLAASLVSSTMSIDVKINYAGDKSKSMKISGENAIVLQKEILSNMTRWVELEASGYGIAVFQVSWVFNLAVSGEDPPFFLNALLDKTSTESYLQLSICTHYREDGGTNMAVMEVDLPSGYLADVDALPSILQIPKVKRVDTDKGDTSVNIYFDNITKDELCVTVPAHRSFKVAHQKPVPVKLYDYYNLAKSTRMFYHPHEATVCDICEGNDCSSSCNTVVEGKSDSQGSGSLPLSRSTVEVLTLSILALFVYNRI